MRRALIIICAIVGLFASVYAQTNFPSFPEGSGNARLLLPNTLDSYVLNQANPTQRYILLADENDALAVSMRRTEGNYIPYLELYNAEGELLAAQEADDLAGRVATLEFEVEVSAWYFLVVGRSDITDGEWQGAYTLALSGTTMAVYELLPSGEPPTLENTPILYYPGEFSFDIETTASYLLPIEEGSSFVVQATGEGNPQLSVTSLDGELLAEGVTEEAGSNLTYTTTENTWVILVVTQTAAAEVSLILEWRATDGVEVAMVPSVLEDFITFTPSPTATNSPTATSSSTPTNTFTPSPTGTATNTPTITFTPSPTFTPSRTPSPTRTPRATSTPTPTDVPEVDLSYGDLVEGRITNRRYEEAWVFEGEEGDVVIITMIDTSDDDDLDPSLILLDDRGDEIAENDDADDEDIGEENAQIFEFELPYDGFYTIIATRYRGEDGRTTGSYVLALATEDIEVELPIVSHNELEYGTVITSEITNSTYEEAWVFEGDEGDNVIITMTAISDDLDPYLILYDENGREIASNDDSDGLNSSIAISLPDDGTYTIIATRYQFDDGNSRGEYVLYLDEFEGPSSDRSFAPSGSHLLTGGVGLTNGRSMNPGEFQIEWYCNNSGYGIGNNGIDWYCTSGGSIVFYLGNDDFDAICQATYDNPTAFAIQDGGSSTPAFNWRCYGY